jgi:hypothetical protein
VYATSRLQNAGAYYTYTGVRYWNFGVSANYNRLTAIAQQFGAFTTYGGGFGITRELTKWVHAVLRFDQRHYVVSNSQFLHNESRVTFGFTFAPGDVPLALW